MKKAFSGALLSGFIFPGFGQVFLGKKALGIALIIIANVGLAGILLCVALRIPLIMEKLEPELAKGQLNFSELIELILSYVHIGGGSILEIVSTSILIVCWIFSVVHAWQTGSQLDKLQN